MALEITRETGLWGPPASAWHTDQRVLMSETKGDQERRERSINMEELLSG